MTDLIGSQLGEYRVEAPLGQSAIGTMFRGAHAQLGMAVTLVVVDSRYADSVGFRARRMQYAQQIIGFSHANVIKTFVCGDQSGIDYIVMEAAGGGALKARPGSPEWNPLNWVSVGFIQQAADGLAAVHARGMAHGDLKLSNLLLTMPDPLQAQVKVSEVGFRQLAGDTQPARDVAQLGGLLYEVITGRPAAQAVRAEFPTGVPEGLRTVVSRCLSDDPRVRFTSCDELSQVLKKIIEESKVAASEPAPAPPLLGVGAMTMPRVPPPPRRKRPAPKHPDPLPAGDLVPSLQIFDDGHAPVAKQFVRGAGITIGRDATNTIVLPSPDVSGSHARIAWSAHQKVTVTDLSSQNGTFYQGKALLPQVEQEWGDEQWVEIGPYWLCLQRPAIAGPPDEGIEVILDPQSRRMELTPGRTAQCRLTLVNRKSQVTHLTPSVQGIPSDWVQVQGPKEVQLEDYRSADVTLNITVPRSPSGRAGDYSVTVVAKSRKSEEAPGTATAQWTVLPFEDMAVSLSPSRSGGLRQARYNLTLHHRGNERASYTLSGTDDERLLEYLFTADDYIDKNRLELKNLEPGSKNVKLKVHAPKRWFGSNKPYAFGVQAGAIAPTQQSVNAEGQFLHRPIFPYWMIAIAPVLIIGLLLLLPVMFRPAVRSVYYEPTSPIAGEPVDVFWEVSRGNIRVLVNDVPVKPQPDSDATKYSFPKGFQRESRVRVIASNLFGEASKEVPVSPTIPPAKPADAAVVQLFTVSPLTIQKPDQQVEIKWKVSNAARVDLMPLGTVPSEGTATHSPPGDQTYTLNAYNKDNVPTTQTRSVRLRAGAINPKDLTLRIISKTGKDKQGMTTVKIGEPIIFEWSVKDAKQVSIDGLGSSAPLTGMSGQKTAFLLGPGIYDFKLKAANDGGEVESQPALRLKAECSSSWFRKIISAGISAGCDKQPQVQWR